MSRSFFTEIKSKAEKRNIEFNIDIEFVWDLFLKQERKCALTGLELALPKRASGSSSPRLRRHTASLDRIDSNKGYIKGNVQWLHKDINWMKNKFNQTYFIELCHQVTKNNPEPVQSQPLIVK